MLFNTRLVVGAVLAARHDSLAVITNPVVDNNGPIAFCLAKCFGRFQDPVLVNQVVEWAVRVIILGDQGVQRHHSVAADKPLINNFSGHLPSNRDDSVGPQNQQAAVGVALIVPGVGRLKPRRAEAKRCVTVEVAGVNRLSDCHFFFNRQAEILVNHALFRTGVAQIPTGGELL